jgi:ribonuclease P protein component
MLLLVHPGARGRTRLGIVASKKLGKSVLRNRLKRLVREVFRRNRKLFPESSDLVIIPKRVRYGITYQSLREEFEELSRRMKR